MTAQHLIEAWQEFHAHEMDIDASPWERWVDKVEALLDLPLPQGLDGDEEEDGYSLDGANDAFCAGQTPRQYADTVRANPLFRIVHLVSKATRDADDNAAASHPTSPWGWREIVRDQVARRNHASWAAVY